MRDFLPSFAFTRHCSWLNSTILSLQPSSRINSTILSKSFLDARRAGENTTISTPNESATAAQKMAMLRTQKRSQAIKDAMVARAGAARGRGGEGEGGGGGLPKRFTKASRCGDHNFGGCFFPAVLFLDLALPA